MSLEIGPPEKKSKLNDTINNNYIETLEKHIESITTSINNLQPITSDEFHNPIELTKVYAGHIRNSKDTSRTILTLNEKIPLKELSHLKRVAWQNIILCPSEMLQNVSSIQEYIEHHITELKDVFDYFKEVNVPLKPPKIVKQYKESKKAWPCNFHPNPYLEKIVGNNFFNVCEVKFHRQCMGLVLEVARWYAIHKGETFKDCNHLFQNFNATVVVDPASRRVIAIAFDHRHKHPMQHSAMLAIDNVAKTQNGGVWSTDSDGSILHGVENELIDYLKEKLPKFTYQVKSSLYLYQEGLNKSTCKKHVENGSPKTEVCDEESGPDTDGNGGKGGLKTVLCAPTETDNIYIKTEMVLPKADKYEGKNGPETELCAPKGNATGVLEKKGNTDSKIERQERSGGKDGPYLCTGYYVYMLREPCIMCSMGLVHARAKRVFFCFQNKEYGGLSSVAKLQTVTSLNHHFEVFTGFL